jgi:ferric-dicitrate binding protein FerR (iron transport regulator)
MDTRLIHRVLTNNATDRERKELSDWIAASSENKEEFHDIRLLWSQASSTIDQNAVGGRFSKIRTHIENEIGKQKRAQMIRAAVIFGVLTLLALIPIAIFHLNDNVPHKYLHFENASVETVIKAIESEYGVTIQVEESELLSCKFTGTFYHIQFTSNVLQELSTAMNLSFEELGNRKFKLKGLGCKAAQVAVDNVSLPL